MAANVQAGFFGARFSIYPMTDLYVPIILEAISALRDGLEIETDDVSTFLGGDRDEIFHGLEQVFARVAASGQHVVMTVLLSHGCPGEEICEPEQASTVAAGTRKVPVPSRTRPGAVDVSCQWSLYPLGVSAYMDTIYRAIDLSKEAGVHEAGRHFVSHLRGDLGEVLGVVRRAFDAACGTSGHVTAHLTLSANSPASQKGSK